MERALDLDALLEALGDQIPGNAAGVPTAEQLQRLVSDLEVQLVIRRPKVADEMLRAGWYLHAVASSNQAYDVFTPARQRRAFQVSAHIFDLALQQGGWDTPSRLRMAFASEIGYRRGTLDPNASSVYRMVATDIQGEPTPLQDHMDTLALEAGAGFLGFDAPRLTGLYSRWRREFGELENTVQLRPLDGTVFGSAQRVVDGCDALLRFLRFGSRTALDDARNAFGAVVSGISGVGDVDARWVAAHMLAFVDEADQGSLWSVLPPDLPPAAKRAFTLSSPPVLTLWPPQRDLLNPPDRPSPLAAEQRRLLMAMPTSAGKTLMAQVLIIGHLADQSGSVCYVTPLRSLAREVRRALRGRVAMLDKRIGRDLPDFEPVAAAVTGITGGMSFAELVKGAVNTDALNDEADFEVLTPERLAGLLRRDAAGVLSRFRLFIFDEAHMLAEPGRGFLFESILSFLHWRTRETDHRIVLLSAAMGNSGQVVAWLGGTDERTLYASEWRGPRRLHAVFGTTIDRATVVRRESVRSKDKPQRLFYPLRGSIRLRTAEGISNVRIRLKSPVGTIAFRANAAGRTVGRRDQQASDTNYRIVARVAQTLGHGGAMLIVTTSRDLARLTAGALAELLPEEPRASPLADIVRSRLGADHPLVQVVAKGVAFHHAGLPTDILDAIEEGLRQDVLRYVACTSTLTEGVNLPVRTVVLAETLYEGQPEALRLRGARLLNAMGRAGRAGRESEGWIVLISTEPERSTEFDRMDVSSDALAVRSRLATDEALMGLAATEEVIRASADAIYTVEAAEVKDFVSYIWFVLASEEELGRTPSAADVPGAVEATFGYSQLDDAARERWLGVAEAVRSAYDQANATGRRRWARAGTSIGSARAMDDLVSEVVTEIVARIAEFRADRTTSPESTLSIGSAGDAVKLLEDLGVFGKLLQLPERPREWRFRLSRGGGRGKDVEVSPPALLLEWMSGKPIPEMGASMLHDIKAEWRLDQLVDTTTEHFEHFLSWMLGVVIESVNNRLESSGIPERLCPGLPAFVRYGVDRSLAIELLSSGVGSRVLAQTVAIAAEDASVERARLRDWLSAMSLSEWRQRFNASASELLDLLEYTRAQRGSLLRTLLEEGSAQITVSIESSGQEEAQASTAGAGEGQPKQPVTIESEPDVPPPGGLLVRALDGDEALLATVPLGSYRDLLDVLDSGVPLNLALSGASLLIQLLLEDERPTGGSE